ncbi:MAG: glycoside hydrolase family 2 TIM barrel-domain containing protein, partial [bacterium]
QDMVNSGHYHYLRDTALPTLHLQRRRDTHLHPDRAQREHFLETMEATARLLGNHPSLCLWTIFNEGWGQFRADEAYLRLRALDPSRFIDTTSGWFHQRLSDVDSLHIYFDPLHFGKEDKPQLLSEFGGWSWKLPEHSANLEKTYGYRKFEDGDTFRSALRDYFAGEVLSLARQGLSGFVYTQVSDVEDETNGLLTYDRRVQKLRPEDIRDVLEEIKGIHKE